MQLSNDGTRENTKIVLNPTFKEAQLCSANSIHPLNTFSIHPIYHLVCVCVCVCVCVQI